MDNTPVKAAAKKHRLVNPFAEVWSKKFLYLLALPAIIYTFIYGYMTLPYIVIAFQKFHYKTGMASPFSGLDNFSSFFRSSWAWAVTRNTLVINILFLIFGTVFAILLALLLNEIVKGRSFFRLLVFIPYVTSVVAISWVWKWMFMANGGVINMIFKALGLPAQQFLNSTSQSILVIMTNVIWASIGFNTIIMLAGLMQIPQTYYEAAQMDGASSWQQFWHITVPQLNPTLVYIAVMGTIRTLQVFTQVYNIAGVEGGPLKSTTSLVLEIYLTAFKRYKMGRASAITVVLFVIIMLITIFQMKVLNRETD